MKRRKFIESSCSLAAFSFLQAHTLLDFDNMNENKGINEKHLIQELWLETASSIESMINFYNKIIGLEIVSSTRNTLKIRAGESILNFEYVDKTGYRPFYHFAFNIPENKIQKAFQWQRNKTPVIHPNPDFAKDQITHFPSWNAHSIFFLDPAGNLLEYIARHDLSNGSAGGFSTKDILYISEIGLVTDNTQETGNKIIKALNISEYRRGSSGFWPIGDERGLILMIGKDRIFTGHTGQINKADVFKTKVRIDSTVQDGWSSNTYPYNITK